MSGNTVEYKKSPFLLEVRRSFWYKSRLILSGPRIDRADRGLISLPVKGCRVDRTNTPSGGRSVYSNVGVTEESEAIATCLEFAKLQVSVL
ncbi:hypothetical protein GCM10007392_12960 [Saccharospirillum salsuginis]|uniref:Uncharacterized protein n=1 Tax=Saccharospirillum salsuginis TaxID=418750 RepID=A0A918K3A3_9GAMM|nr:hypothetical protein GCM10007392_12960 [Saccharospirillum salsuginis]